MSPNIHVQNAYLANCQRQQL